MQTKNKVRLGLVIFAIFIVVCFKLKQPELIKYQAINIKIPQENGFIKIDEVKLKQANKNYNLTYRRYKMLEEFSPLFKEIFADMLCFSDKELKKLEYIGDNDFGTIEVSGKAVRDTNDFDHNKLVKTLFKSSIKDSKGNEYDSRSEGRYHPEGKIVNFSISGKYFSAGAEKIKLILQTEEGTKEIPIKLNWKERAYKSFNEVEQGEKLSYSLNTFIKNVQTDKDYKQLIYKDVVDFPYENLKYSWWKNESYKEENYTYDHPGYMSTYKNYEDVYVIEVAFAVTHEELYKQKIYLIDLGDRYEILSLDKPTKKILVKGT